MITLTSQTTHSIQLYSFFKTHERGFGLGHEDDEVYYSRRFVKWIFKKNVLKICLLIILYRDLPVVFLGLA